MAIFDNIIQEIETNLPDNNTQAITAKKLRDTLKDLTYTIEGEQTTFEGDITEQINNLLGGRYYGYAESVSDLPTTGTPGYAIVGSSSPYHIYNFDGQTWTDSGIEVQESGGPDDEDINYNSDQKLQFANRVYNTQSPDGLGYTILRKNRTFAEQVTAANTIYEIKYDFNLNAATVTLPANVTLKFNGGSLTNGTLRGNNTTIDAADVKVFDNITFTGTYKGALNAIWVGAVPTTTTANNSPIIQRWFSSYYRSFRTLYFPEGSYYFTETVSMTADRRSLMLDGRGSNFYVNIEDVNDKGQYFLNLSNSSASGSAGEDFIIKDIFFRNARTTGSYNISKTRAIKFNRTQKFRLQNVGFWYFDIAMTIIDVWYGSFEGRTYFRNNRVGIEFLPGAYYETNTINITSVNFAGVTDDVCKALYPQNDGETEAAWNMRIASVGIDAYTLMQGVSIKSCTFELLNYGIRMNWHRRSASATVDGGSLSLHSNYFEANRAYDLYVGTGNANHYGTGSSYMRFTHIINMIGTRAFSDPIVYLLGVDFLSLSNQSYDVKFGASDYVSNRFVYDKDVTIIGTIPASTVVSRNGSVRAYTQTNGNKSLPTTNFQKLQITRDFDNIMLNLPSTSLTANALGNNFKTTTHNLNTLPGIDLTIDRAPNRAYFDGRNSFYKIRSVSGNSIGVFNISTDFNFSSTNHNGLSLFEFLRRWKAGTAYTGVVEGLFAGNSVICNPTEGSVRREDTNALVGFGINGIGTVITNTTANGYYTFVDGLIVARTVYSRLFFYSDLFFNGRTYSEILPGTTTTTSVNPKRIYGTTSNQDAVLKRLNAVYYNTDTSKLMIYNGFEWVEMTNPWQRYYYKEYGNSIVERATFADLPGQKYVNQATGIVYTFALLGGDTANPKWLSSVGEVLSLDHPNGYTSTNNLNYATELTAGEQVRYNGIIYTWDGTQFNQ